MFDQIRDLIMGQIINAFKYIKGYILKMENSIDWLRRVTQDKSKNNTWKLESIV